jgi:ribonuclease D
MSLLTSSAELAAVCARFAQHAFVTVDTEFLRETTFWPKVCVIQIASDDEAIAIDTLTEDLDLAPFFELMANPRIVKVFHAARQDLEIIWKLSRLIPAPLFDTQVAAMVCGFGDQVSYGELAQSISKVQIDKSSRFTGRIGWLDDEMATLKNPATYEQHPDSAWERLRGRARKPRDLAVLMEIAAWREREAQTRDVPRSRVLKDDVLIDIALAAPKTADALAQLRSFPRGMERARTGVDILAAIERGLARDPKTLPKIERDKRGNNSAGATVELLKVLLRHVCEAHSVAAKMVATVDDLEAIATDDRADVPALTGWRREMFGLKALELKHGRLALTLEKGKVIALEWQEAPLVSESVAAE